MNPRGAELLLEMQAVLDDWAAAIVADDAARIAAFAYPDWVLVTPEAGAVPLERFCEAVSSGALSHDAMEFTVLDARRHGDVVTVRAHGTNSGTFSGKPFRADEWVTEVFVHDGRRWRCTLSALTPRTIGTPPPNASSPTTTPHQEPTTTKETVQ
ncbi:nuclear transport factor 2 family protein [Tessaracoccus sp. OS52]|uniref:nuclear transport factor 2 family protein n=1 Tax=Tessaracoccus sp. OS52 TaxID=2886691 RepID=UPI001D113132|nr:nuclear transport factor 2 family protein [Tessaracoccus sp. OS52]MCC2593942.1 nuclear transport factor 2 family protein [Tessaracoccus sp. OS52]